MHYNRELQELIQKMLESNVIRPPASDWAAPTAFVKKQDGTLHLCVGYRRLKSATEKDYFPCSTSIRFDGGARYFTTLDVAPVYW